MAKSDGDKLTDVDKKDVGKTVHDFINKDDATKVVCTEQADGKWTVTASYD
jgi:hypothetical protein